MSWFNDSKRVKCDVLVIGSGGAGLRAAIAAAEAGAIVLMVSKSRIGQVSNTILSKSVIAASGLGSNDDSAIKHGLDTLEGGRYLNDLAIVNRFTEAIQSEVEQLRKWGVEFVSAESVNPKLFKFPGHSQARHVVGKNWLGRDLVRPMLQKALALGVSFEERLFVSKLIAIDNQICGATCISPDGRFVEIVANAVVLATGGFGHLYLNTNNAPDVTGDGHALAGDVGVRLQDMEFVQFYPTTLGKRGRRILLYERLLTQKGVVLRDGQGEDLLRKHDNYKPDEITRDQLAQLIMKEILADPKKQGAVFFDLSGLDVKAETEMSALLPPGWAEGKRIFQVSPTTHFCMGGVVVDQNGETSCQGLFAAGEVTAGAHGANRLIGNALAELLVMGAHAGKNAAQKLSGQDCSDAFAAASSREMNRLKSFYGRKGLNPEKLTEEIKRTMWFEAGIIRNRESLNRALKAIEKLKKAPFMINSCADLIRYLEFANLALVGEMVCLSALARNESRGAHYRTDFPLEDNDRWKCNIAVALTGKKPVLEW